MNKRFLDICNQDEKYLRRHELYLLLLMLKPFIYETDSRLLLKRCHGIPRL